MVIGGFLILCSVMSICSLGLAGFLAYKDSEHWGWFLAAAVVAMGAGGLVIEEQLRRAQPQETQSVEENGSDPAG